MSHSERLCDAAKYINGVWQKLGRQISYFGDVSKNMAENVKKMSMAVYYHRFENKHKAPLGVYDFVKNVSTKCLTQLLIIGKVRT